jgi:uncharacterized coiled-coil DUF342 family protein
MHDHPDLGKQYHFVRLYWERHKDVNRERTNPSDGKKRRGSGEAKIPFDVIRNLTRCLQPKVHDQTSPSETPATRHQEKRHSLQNTADNAIIDLYEEKVKRDISRYQKELEKCESELTEVKRDLKVSYECLEQLQRKKDEHQTIRKQSEQVLDDHKQRLRDPQREQEELNEIDATVAPLLKELRDVQKKIANLTKRRDKPRNNIQNAKRELSRAIKPFKQALYVYLSFSDKNDLLQEKSNRHEELKNEVNNSLITPADEVYIQCNKYKLSHNIIKDIQNAVNEELTWCSSHTIPFAHESTTDSLPEQLLVHKITQLSQDVQRSHNLMNVGQWCSDESRVKVQELADNIQQLHNDAKDTYNQLNEYHPHSAV